MRSRTERIASKARYLKKAISRGLNPYFSDNMAVCSCDLCKGERNFPSRQLLQADAIQKDWETSYVC